jgi:GNAT superfamily N-acetyltransferase
MRTLRLPLAKDDYRELPRNPAYKYEYIDGEVWISPRPHFRHCQLDLASGPASEAHSRSWNGSVRALNPEDWPHLPQLFAWAFRDVEPFAGLNEPALLHAANTALHQTRTGGDGPLIAEACVLAENEDGLAGAALVTLLPLVDPTTWDAYSWRDPPPADAVATRQGRPHLTWIFVPPFSIGRGVGSALLLGLCARLRTLGFTELLSTFLEGNTRSMVWHWRMGFTLLQHPESYRRTTRAWVSR